MNSFWIVISIKFFTQYLVKSVGFLVSLTTLPLIAQFGQKAKGLGKVLVFANVFHLRIRGHCALGDLQ